MGVNSVSNNDDDAGRPRDPDPAGAVDLADLDAPTRRFVSAGMSDRCVNCDSPLASDQRYCLTCGERRGKSRFSAQSMVSPAAESPAPSSEQRREPNRRRISSGATLVTGIATLLLAMGVGVEIGRTGKGSNTTPARASAPSVQVVTVGGSGAASGPASTIAAPKQAKAKAANSSSSNNSKQAQTVVTKKVAAKATAAASKVLGASAKNLAPPTVQTGQACSHGAGCQNGKFTGNFFAP